MFGFSLQKLIFTALIIVVVIYGFKAISRLQERRAAAENDRAGGDGGGRVKAQSPAPATPAEQGTEDMVACRVCGTYVASTGTRSCGRDDCPYPG